MIQLELSPGIARATLISSVNSEKVTIYSTICVNCNSSYTLSALLNPAHPVGFSEAIRT